MRDWWLQGRAMIAERRLVDGVSGEGDGRCLIRLEHLIMPVWGEPWMAAFCEWPLEDREVSAAVNPIYPHGASGLSF